MLTRRKLLKGLAGGAGAVAATAIAKPAEARAPRKMPDQAVGLLFDGTLCIGCRACMPACKAANGMPPERTALEGGDYWDAPLDISGSTLNVIKAYRDGGGSHKDQVTDGFAFTKVSCMHCVDPSCVSACPVSAMTKDKVTGIVKYNVDACIGCRYCVAACPFNVPRFTYDTPFPKISKCQLCQHRMGDGHYAACAEVCPTGATLFGPVAELKKEIARRRALTPGAHTSYPRGKIGGTDSYQGVAGKYVDHVYGETEIGGTQVLHLSGVPFELLNKPKLPDVSPARISESLQHAIYSNLIAPLGFLGALAFVAWRHMRPAAEPSPAGASGPAGPGDPPARPPEGGER
jgi:Fe-S-cluster-containing dehydrogenase component